MAPTYAARWQAMLPHAALASVEGAGHMVPYEQPERLATAILEFLAEVGGRDAAD